MIGAWWDAPMPPWTLARLAAFLCLAAWIIVRAALFASACPTLSDHLRTFTCW